MTVNGLRDVDLTCSLADKVYVDPSAREGREDLSCRPQLC